MVTDEQEDRGPDESDDDLIEVDFDDDTTVVAVHPDDVEDGRAETGGGR